jgi:adenylate kinase
MGKSIIFIGGPSGAGKTTSSTELSKGLKNSEKFRFCKVMDEEANRLVLSQKDLLQQRYYLQTLLTKNLIKPKLDANKAVIFDLHYSQPLSDNPAIVFARRVVSLKHDYCMSLGNDFLRDLAQINVPLFFFLLTADEPTLQSRLRLDSIHDRRDYMSSLNMIRKDIASELEFYKKTLVVLNGFGALVEHIEIKNHQNMQEKTIQTMLRKIAS